MSTLKIAEGTIDSFKFKDGEYTITMKFRKGQVETMSEAGIEHYCNRIVKLEIDEVQVDAFKDEPSE